MLKKEKNCPHKNLHTKLYSSFIHNCQKLEATQMSFNRCIDKLWYIHTVDCYSRHKKTWRELKCKLLSERSQSEKATYCMIPII